MLLSRAFEADQSSPRVVTACLCSIGSILGAYSQSGCNVSISVEVGWAFGLVLRRDLLVSRPACCAYNAPDQKRVGISA